MEPIRILHSFTIMNRGGAETMIMNYYRALDRDKIQFDFVVHRAVRGCYDDEIERLGGRIYRLPPFNPLKIGQFKRELDRLFTEHPEYRIVHAHNCTYSMYILRAAMQHGVPTRIAHSHLARREIDFKTPFFGYSNLRIGEFLTHGFACSRSAAQWQFGRKNLDNTRILKNALDLSDFAYSNESRQASRKTLAIDNQAYVIGHVGRFNPSKNHAFLLEIFAKLGIKAPQAILMLAGDGSLRPNLEAKAIDLGIADRVRFLGVRGDIPELLQAMDVFVFPSLFEALPVTVIEAQAAGLPCLLSDTITRECDVTGNVQFLPLSAGPEAWATEILKRQGIGRLPDAVQRVAQAGYDVQTNAKWLEEFYLCEYRASL